MRLLFSAAGIAVAMSAFGGQVQFSEIRGVQEFSGRMIARPLQMTEMLEKSVPYHVALATQAKARSIVQPHAVKRVGATDEYIIRVPQGKNENSLAKELMASGAFQYVEPDWIVFPLIDPNDPSYPQQWHHLKIQSNMAWDLFRGNNTITIAITDTGVSLGHPDLAPLLVPGANSATGTAIPQGQPGGDVMDINGHGTHCAGIAAAASNNAIGVAGVGWNFKIMPVRVSNSSGGGSSFTALTEGARWAADNGARVISTSYSGVSSATIQTTGNYIKTQRNGIYLWAAGNSNSNLSTFDHADVTIVGATDSNDNKASFSSYGQAVDVFAPGVNILSTHWTSANPNSYAYMSGTSMATPCAAGVAAMIMAANPVLTGQEVETVLYQSCNDLLAPPGGPGNDSYWGWGRVNVNLGIRKVHADFLFNALAFAVGGTTTPAGGLTEVRASDDTYLHLANQVDRSGHTDVEFTGNTTLLAVNQISLTLETRVNTTNFVQAVDMFDYIANAWVMVDNRAGPTTDQTITITPSAPARFVQFGTGQMKARVRYDRFIKTITPGQAWIDRVGWKTTPL